MAQSGHSILRCECPLSGVKRTWVGALQMSAWLGSQFYIDMVSDLTTIILFGIAVWNIESTFSFS
jgi:hypothetical protein